MRFDNEYLIWEKGEVPGNNPTNWPWVKYEEQWQHPADRDEDLVRWVTEPTIRVFLPEKSKNTGAAVLICPGGGYNIIEIDKEGYKVARKLQQLGIAGIVLKYRHYDVFAARDDGQRAMRFIRSKAKDWGVDPNAIGMGGFSAGGHLAIHCAANLNPKVDWVPDAIDHLSNQPNFMMLIYPSTRMPKGVEIGAQFPPTFISAAADDQYKLADACGVLFNKLQELKIPSELHIYQKGGHGYGVGTPECQCASWIELFANWLKVNGFVK